MKNRAMNFRDKEIVDIAKKLDIEIKSYLIDENKEKYNKIREIFFHQGKAYQTAHIKNHISLGGASFPEIKRFKSNKAVYLVDGIAVTDYIFEFKNLEEMYKILSETGYCQDVILVATDLSFIIAHDEDNSVLYYAGNIEYVE